MKTNYMAYVQKLKDGETVAFRPRGNSMLPRIKSGQLLTIAPVPLDELKKGDVVFCKVKGRFFTHLLSAVQGDRFQISNNKGHVNGWIGANGIFGKVIKVED